MPNHSNDDLIRLIDDIKGSSIWNKAWDNKAIIQKNNFSEIGNGEKSIFWKNSWQQLPNLNKDQLTHLQTAMKKKLKNMLSHYWKPNNRLEKWREWLEDKYLEPLPIGFDWNTFPNTIQEIQNQFDRGEDKIKWGKISEGHLNLKEAYGYKENHDQL